MVGDISYCATFCDQADCERNLRFNKPTQKFYSVTTFDDSNLDQAHKTCGWKIRKEEQNMNKQQRELIKHLIMSIKDVVDSEIAMRNVEIFDDEAISKIFEGSHKAGYEMFKILYLDKFEKMDDETEEKVFAKFNDFLYNREQTAHNEYVAFDNLCNWFEREV